MPTDLAPAAARPARSSPDDGFTLIEVLVAMAVIGTVMTALAPFLIKSVLVVDQQRSQQVAVQVANDALERARALDPSSLLAGRGRLETQRQWAAAPAAVAGYLATTTQVWDALPDTSTAGPRAPLPTVPNVVNASGINYSQSWYIGRCWQTKLKPGESSAGDCKANPATTTDVPFFRVVAAVTWAHRSCALGQCIYVATTLASTGDDPRFELNQPPPVITDPPNQTGYVTVDASLQLVVTDGARPLVWSATGMPPGLTVSAGGLINGKPTAAGTYSVVVTATAQDGKADNTTFTWIIALLPTLTSPGDQVSRVRLPDSLSVAEVGGLLPLVWSASQLPAGLTINAATGLISGTPTTVQTQAVTVTVADAGVPPRTASVSFSWRVLSRVTLVDPGDQTLAAGTVLSGGTFAFSASGGATPYTWRAENLPRNLSLNASTGAVTGTILDGTRYVVNVYVTDSFGDVDSISLILNITGGDIRVTAPNPSSPDRSTTLGVFTSVTAGATGGFFYSWSATNLPPGLSISTGGVISGRPTVRGTYLVTLSVSDLFGRGPAVLMFTWTVT